jgi:hypothetical protein
MNTSSTQTQNQNSTNNAQTSSNQSENQTTTQNPWGLQANYLTDAFSKAQGALGTAYNGDRVAQFNPAQLATFNAMLGYGNNSVAPGAATGAGTALTGAGSSAATGALARLGAFSPTGTTQSNIDAANSYADAAASPAAVDAAMRDARRQVYEGALPGIDASSAATGNNMSSRSDMSKAIIERGLADKTADVSSTLRQTAFNNGLNLAQNQSQFNDNAILDALKSSGALGTSAVGAGTGALGAGTDIQGKLFDLANAGGAGLQAADQSGINNDISKSDATWDNLAKYFGIVGGSNWGGSTSSTGSSSNSGTMNSTGTMNGTTESTPSIWQVIGGLMSAGGSLMKSDIRAKWDITRIGTAHNGLPLYTFRYKDGGGLHVGLMAQDVEKVKPEAVTEIGGVKHVDYALALAE